MSKELKYNRILLKLSGEALMGQQGFGIDADVVSRIAGEIKDVHSLGVQVAKHLDRRFGGPRADGATQEFLLVGADELDPDGVLLSNRLQDVVDARALLES